jgi:hypothetical protein
MPFAHGTRATHEIVADETNDIRGEIGSVVSLALCLKTINQIVGKAREVSMTSQAQRRQAGSRNRRSELLSLERIVVLAA